MTGLSIIVPVRNEAARIAETARLLLTGLPPGSELIFVLNGCTDDSEARLKQVCGTRAIIAHSPPSKTKALNVGDQLAAQFPRFYIDADVEIAGSAVAQLAARLAEHGAMLVSPRLDYDVSGASTAARWVTEAWLALPHSRTSAFHQVIGVSEAGRAQWGPFPDIIADDSYIVAAIPAAKRHLAEQITARVRPPWNLKSFVGVRRRWRAGQRQLADMGVCVAYAPGQKAALLRNLLNPAHLVPTLLYAVTVLYADTAERLSKTGPGRWYQDVSSR